MAKCFCCGTEVKLSRPFHTPVYGTVEKVAYIDICMGCWDDRKDRAKIRSRADFDKDKKGEVADGACR